MKRNTCKVFNVKTGKLIARNCSYDFAEQLANSLVDDGGLVTRQNGSFMMMWEPIDWTEEQVYAFLNTLPKRDKRNKKRWVHNNKAYYKQLKQDM